MTRKPKAPARRKSRAPTEAEVKAALDELEAAGLIKRDREAEAKDGLLHYSIAHWPRPKAPKR